MSYLCLDTRIQAIGIKQDIFRIIAPTKGAIVSNKELAAREARAASV